MNHKGGKVISPEELKVIQLNILKHIKLQCEKYHLRYFLAYGSLLGAVRHQGFIPWDDDIDIWMPREDYNKLLNLRGNIESSEYRLLSCKYVKDYYYPFAKMVDSRTHLVDKSLLSIKNNGVFIDIFPLDGIPRKYEIIRSLIKRITFCRTLVATKNSCLNSGILLKYLIGVISARKYAQLENWLVENYSYSTHFFVGTLQQDGKVLDKAWFSDVVELKFEDEYFDVPVGYRECLSKLYGEYMKYPPENERISFHGFKAFHK